jgi:hypothetical protein
MPVSRPPAKRHPGTGALVLLVLLVQWFACLSHIRKPGDMPARNVAAGAHPNPEMQESARLCDHFV